MVEIAIPFNRRTVQFAQRRQHLVNHGLQRDVNHSRQTPHRYFRLTQNIKRIPTRFCHDFRVTRHKAGRGRVSRRQCEVANTPGRAVLYGSTLPACLCGSLPATRLPTGRCARSNFMANALSCGAPCAARAWPSICWSKLSTQRGSSTTASAQLDQLHVERPRPRRRRRSALKTRRPSILLRRATRKITNVTPVPSRRTGNYRAKLDFRLEGRSSLFAALELHSAGFHNQLDVIGIHFVQNNGCVRGADLPGAEFVDDAMTRWTSGMRMTITALLFLGAVAVILFRADGGQSESSEKGAIDCTDKRVIACSTRRIAVNAYSAP